MTEGGEEAGAGALRIERGWTVARFPILDRADRVFHLFIGKTIEGKADGAAELDALFPPPLARRRAVRLRQVHGARVVDARSLAARGEAGAVEADASLTDVPGLLLRVRTADCLPVYLVDPEGPVVALAHAGWRGLVAGVIEETVARMRAGGSAPTRLLAAIGPSIGPCCYEVGEEVAEKLGIGARPRPGGRGRPHVDLFEAAGARLLAAGLLEERIGPRPACTACAADRLHSYRREKERVGRNEAWLAILPQAKLGSGR